MRMHMQLCMQLWAVSGYRHLHFPGGRIVARPAAKLFLVWDGEEVGGDCGRPACLHSPEFRQTTRGVKPQRSF